MKSNVELTELRYDSQEHAYHVLFTMKNGNTMRIEIDMHQAKSIERSIDFRTKKSDERYIYWTA